MEKGKRIRLIFKDDDILSDAQKFEGLSRSWVLLKPPHHASVSDFASHLLHAFQLHQSCPHGLLLSISGFVLPPFESTSILKDNEIISVRKRKDVLSIEGNDAPKDVLKLKDLGKQPLNSGVLLLTSEEFEKEKGGYESEESEDDDGGLLGVVENSSGADAKTRNRKRKAAERLQGYKKKKQRSEVKHSGNTSSDVCIEKKDVSKAGDNVENRYHPAKHSDTNIMSTDGVRRKKKKHSEANYDGNTSTDACIEKKDLSIAGDNMENRDEPAKDSDTNIVSGDGVRRRRNNVLWLSIMEILPVMFAKRKKNGSMDGDNLENCDELAKPSDSNIVSENGVKRTVEVLEKDKETDDIKIAPEETPKVASRSARRKKAKRIFRREMAKIQQQNATCESEGLRNWKEDQAKAVRKKLDGKWKGQHKWKNNQVDAERNEADGQPKGLLHWKLSSQNSELVKGKKCKHYQNDDFLELPNQNGDMNKQHDKKGDRDVYVTEMGNISERPDESLNEQPGQNIAAVRETTNQNCDASKQSNHERVEENGVLPIVVRPGHIRFEPLEEEEHTVRQDHAPLETFNWNGITSKKKGQQWGKENRRFTPRNNNKKSNEDSGTLTTEKKQQPNEKIDFDKLPPLLGIPKEGDLIAYQVLELSSTWTPELSAHRVGKVSWYNMETSQIMLLPVPEYPIFPEKDDGDEAAQLDNTLYKEDGSLEIDFPSLIDVRVLTNGRSEPGNEAVTCISEASTGNVNALETALPDRSDKPTPEPNPEEIGGSIWDQLSESINAKKEQLAKENGWGSSPKKVLVLRKPKPKSGLEAQKPQPSQSTGSKSWSYKALRGSGLGPTMAMLRSKKDRSPEPK